MNVAAIKALDPISRNMVYGIGAYAGASLIYGATRPKKVAHPKPVAAVEEHHNTHHDVAAVTSTEAVHITPVTVSSTPNPSSILSQLQIVNSRLEKIEKALGV